MTAYALEHGVNYFDTAYPYHGGESERVIGRVLSKYPRDSYYLADKYPGHQISREDIFLSTKIWASEYEKENAVEKTLEILGVDYIDLLYIHQPSGNYMAGYRLLEKAYKDGKICGDSFSAHTTREHNDTNVLALSARLTGAGLALKIVDTFLNTPFSNDKRHINRIMQIENG